MQPSTLLCGKRPSGKLQNGERAASLRRTTWRSSHKSTLILQFALTVFVCITVLIPPTRSNAQQIAGSLSGKVTDAVGASVASAKLTATNTQTGVAATTTSDSDGAYTFPSLAPGMYKLSAEQTGFSLAVTSNISLDVYQKLVVNVTLRVGSFTQNVTVSAAAPLIDTTTASIGTTVDKEEIDYLPLNLQQVGALALTVPGTVNTSDRSMSAARGNGSGFNDQSYSGSGGTSGSNLLLIDGMISRALNNSSFALNPPPEMVHEFKIQSNIYDAAYGWSSGTVMNLISESGTNAIHGSAFELWRNGSLDAVNFFAVSSPPFNRNQFGGAVGGPIRKNKMFYFAAYEGLRMSEGQTISNPVPTAEQRSDNFGSLLTGTTANLCAASGSAAPNNLNFDTGQLFDPKTEYSYTCPADPANPAAGVSTVLVGQPIPGNDISAYLGANLDPVAQKVLARFPLPNAANGTNYVNQTPLGRQDDQLDGRFDWVPSEKDSLFVRFLLGNSNQQIPTALPEFGQYQHYRGSNLVGGWTHPFSSSLINDVRIGYQRDYLIYSCQGCPRPTGTLAGFGIAGLAASSSQTEEYPNFQFVNFATWGDGFPGFFPDVVPDSLIKVEDSLTLVRGRHTIAVGGDANFWKTEGLEDPLNLNGLISLNGQYSSLAGESTATSAASDLADLELGYPSSGQYSQHPIVTNLTGGLWFGLFAQDSVRLSSKLTVGLGLRWEYRRQPVDTHNQIATLFPLSKTYQPGDAMLLTALPNAANDALCSNTYFVSATGQCLVMTSAKRAQEGLNGNQVRQVSYGPGKGDFGPRVGISWQPLASDKLVLHVGGGIFYDMPDTNRQGSYANNSSVFTRTPVYQTAFGAPPPSSGGAPVTTETMFQNSYALNVSQVTSSMMPSPFYHTPTVYEWSLGLQSQLTTSVAAELDYVGNRGIHNDNSHFNGNQARPGLGDLQPRRPWPDFNTIAYDSYDAFSNYAALQVELKARSHHGLTGLLAYTYSKTLDDNGGDNENGFTGPQDDNNMRGNYALSDFDIAHHLVLSGVYQLPFGSGQAFLNQSPRWVDRLIGGWHSSALINYQTGFPFTVVSSNDYSNTSSFSPRPDRVCDGKGTGSVTNWFNTNCFSTTALAQSLAAGLPRFGTSGRNILRGPGVVNTDISLIKRSQLADRLSSEFRVDAFNIFNHPNFGPPNAVIGGSIVGQITSASAARELQLGVKLVF